jgi:hypothetical protein
LGFTKAVTYLIGAHLEFSTFHLAEMANDGLRSSEQIKDVSLHLCQNKV